MTTRSAANSNMATSTDPSKTTINNGNKNTITKENGFQLKRNVINFSAGPAKLPHKVLMKAQKELLNYNGCGVSVLEMSHRGTEFSSIMGETESRLRTLLDIPDNYSVIFMQGGGSAQFSAVPMNLMRCRDGESSPTADYIVTGTWSAVAAKEAAKFGKVRQVLPPSDAQFQGIPSTSSWSLNPHASYLYYCANETVHGIEFPFIPEPPEGVPLVCDMSSNFMSRPIDISKYGLIFAGAQKNIGCAGVTVVIVRNDLLHFAHKYTPAIMEYKTHALHGSMYNTPPTFGIYIVGLVLEWVEAKGGLEAMQRRSQLKAKRVYDFIDGSDGFYRCHVSTESRSHMNIVFRIKDDDSELESQFVKEAHENGLKELKGHRSIGGLRASLYNAMRLVEVDYLLNFMRSFQEKHSSPQTINGHSNGHFNGHSNGDFKNGFH